VREEEQAVFELLEIGFISIEFQAGVANELLLGCPNRLTAGAGFKARCHSLPFFVECKHGTNGEAYSMTLQLRHLIRQESGAGVSGFHSIRIGVMADSRWIGYLRPESPQTQFTSSSSQRLFPDYSPGREG
jgi:hypothetical protein